MSRKTKTDTADEPHFRDDNGQVVPRSPLERSVRVGDYVLTDVLGRGSFATVRLARHIKSGCQFAAKVIDKRKLALDVFEKQVRRECQILRKLDHPNIAKIHQVFMSKSAMYLIIDYIEGDELYDSIVRSGKLEELPCRTIFRHIGSALEYCHRNAVYHRDVKPENVLVNKQSLHATIVDFGMGWIRDPDDAASRAGDGDPLMYTQCGTPRYMPPEILESPDRGYHAEKVDVFAFGMTLYAALAGKLPYRGEAVETNDVLQQILERDGRVDHPAWFGTQVRDLLDKCLAIEPYERPTMTDVLRHPWFRAEDLCNDHDMASSVTGSSALRASRCSEVPMLSIGVPIDGPNARQPFSIMSPVTPSRRKPDKQWHNAVTDATCPENVTACTDTIPSADFHSVPSVSQARPVSHRNARPVFSSCKTFPGEQLDMWDP